VVRLVLSCSLRGTTVDRIDPEHLLISTNGGNVWIHTETWTDELLFDWGQVVHATLIVHTITHVENLLTTTSLLTTNIGETLHLSLRGYFDTRNEIILFETGCSGTIPSFVIATLLLGYTFRFYSGTSPSSINKTSYG
jgi:hypothetical protein